MVDQSSPLYACVWWELDLGSFLQACAHLLQAVLAHCLFFNAHELIERVFFFDLLDRCIQLLALTDVGFETLQNFALSAHGVLGHPRHQYLILP